MIALAPMVVSLAGAIIAWGAPVRVSRAVALIAALGALAAALALPAHYDRAHGDWQQMAVIRWMPQLGAQVQVGLNGVGLVMMIMVGAVTVGAILSAWQQGESAKGFHGLALALAGCAYGTLIAVDLFLLVTFYAAIPAILYFLIAGDEEEAGPQWALRFSLLSLAGAALILCAILIIYFETIRQSMDMTKLIGGRRLATGLQIALFPCIVAGFASMAGWWPLHGPLRRVLVASPAPVAILLSGVAMPLAGYGCLRLGTLLLPVGAATWAPVLGFLAMATIVYGALTSLAQRELRGLLACATIGQMGVALLGLAAANENGLDRTSLPVLSHGIEGALLQFVANAMGAALLWALIRSTKPARASTASDAATGSLPSSATTVESAQVAFPGVPLWLCGAAALAWIGIPGGGAFIAELHILTGVARQPLYGLGMALAASAGLALLSVCVILKMASFATASQHKAPETPSFLHTSWLRLGVILVLLPPVFFLGLGPALPLQMIDAGLYSPLRATRLQYMVTIPANDPPHQDRRCYAGSSATAEGIAPSTPAVAANALCGPSPAR